MTEAPSWRHVIAAAGGGDEVWRIAEHASGYDRAALVVALDERVTTLAYSAFTAMVERRATGEPLQYVLGAWGFRTLDLMVDRRVLIPRPETEFVVECALERFAGGTAVDLGTGSGAIALSIAAERPGATVIATDVSVDALAVARANLAGLGRAAARVRLCEGSWYGALPPELRGTVDLIVSNPPYVADGEVLPPEVAGWEPAAALRAGPTGLEAIEVVVRGAREWLRAGGVLAVEIGETQAGAATALASEAGFEPVEVRRDFAGKPRALIATAPSGAP